MSSTFAPDDPYPASRVIDDVMTDPCVSSLELNAWLSVRVAESTRIGWVAVYNRLVRPDLLGSFQVWIGASAGDTSSSAAAQCGDTVTGANTPGPFVF